MRNFLFDSGAAKVVVGLRVFATLYHEVMIPSLMVIADVYAHQYKLGNLENRILLWTVIIESDLLRITKIVLSLAEDTSIHQGNETTTAPFATCEEVAIFVVPS